MDAVEAAYNAERATASALRALTLEPDAVSGDLSRFELRWRTAGAGQQWLLRLNFSLETGEMVANWGRTDWADVQFYSVVELCTPLLGGELANLLRPVSVMEGDDRPIHRWKRLATVLASELARFVEGRVALLPRERDWRLTWTDADRQILEKMRAVVSSMPTDVSQLEVLVGALEALEALLTGVDTGWSSEFHQHWSALDQCLALASSGELSPPYRELEGLIGASVVKLRAMLEPFLR